MRKYINAGRVAAVLMLFGLTYRLAEWQRTPFQSRSLTPVASIYVESGEGVSHPFLVDNRSDSAIGVSVVASSCQCTSVELSRSEIPAHGAIEATMNVEPHTGNVSRTVHALLRTSDSARPDFTCTLNVSWFAPCVINPADIEPQEIEVASVKTVTCEVVTRHRSGTCAPPLWVAISGNGARLRRREEKTYEERYNTVTAYLYDIDLFLPNGDSGPHNATLVAQTGEVACVREVSWQGKTHVHCFPESLYFSRARTETKAIELVVDEGIRCISARSPNSQIDVTLVGRTGDRRYRADVTSRPGEAVTTEVEIITTDGPLRIPVYVM